MRKKLLWLVPLLMAVSSLQGCFPVVATGVGTGVLMAEDRRSSGIFIEDQEIELKAGNRISEKFGDKVHIDVTSFNLNVLLTGEAPTEQLKQEVEQVVRGVPNVRYITNAIAIAGPSSLASRSNDVYLTSKVKARFIDADKFQVNHVKVVTENGVVYLLGLVTHKEAAEATEIARTTGGVQKVVQVFQYIN